MQQLLLLLVGLSVGAGALRYIGALRADGRHADRWLRNGAGLGLAGGWIAGGFGVHAPTWTLVTALILGGWTIIDRSTGAWVKRPSRTAARGLLLAAADVLVIALCVVGGAACLLGVGLWLLGKGVLRLIRAALKRVRELIGRHPRATVTIIAAVAIWILGAIFARFGYYVVVAAFVGWIAAELHPTLEDRLRRLGRQPLTMTGWVARATVFGLCVASQFWSWGIRVPDAWVALVLPATVIAIRRLPRGEAARRRAVIGLGHAATACAGVTAAAELRVSGSDLAVFALLAALIAAAFGCQTWARFVQGGGMHAQRMSVRGATALALTLTGASACATGFALATILGGGAVVHSEAVHVGAPALAAALATVAGWEALVIAWKRRSALQSVSRRQSGVAADRK